MFHILENLFNLTEGYKSSCKPLQLIFSFRHILGHWLELISAHAASDNIQFPFVYICLGNVFRLIAKSHGDDSSGIADNPVLHNLSQTAGKACGIIGNRTAMAISNLLNLLNDILPLAVDYIIGSELLRSLQGLVINVTTDYRSSDYLARLQNNGSDSPSSQNKYHIIWLNSSSLGAVCANSDGLNQGRILPRNAGIDFIDIVLGGGKYSLQPPSVPLPLTRTCSQTFSRPCVHCQQVPQVITKSTTTWSPG